LSERLGILRFMAESGRVVVAGQFPAGTLVSLWRVRGEGVLRHEGGELVATSKVPEDGRLEFDRDVEVGPRYIAYGYTPSGPVSVRARGLDDGEVAGTLSQPPIQPDALKHADGQPVSGVYVPGAGTAQSPPAEVPDEGEAEEPGGSMAPETLQPLRGAALDARVKELGIEGASKMSADEKRAAVADAEAAAGNDNEQKAA